MIKNMMIIAAGGALGSLARYALTLLSSQLLIRAEWATFAANICGAFLIGLITPDAASEYFLFFAVGICGGFTTFSTFSSQAAQMLHQGQYVMALLYMAGTTVLSLAMVALGWYCRHKIWG